MNMQNFCQKLRFAGGSMASADYFWDPAETMDLPAARKFREWRFDRLASVHSLLKLYR